MDDYTETENKSWFQRLGESFAGVATGFVLIAAATWLLWWNEERTFKTAGAIGEAELVTQNVQDISRVDPALEGKVIHATGKADTQDIVRDPLFGVSANAISLRRKVQYYQWEEHRHTKTRKKAGGGTTTVTTYTYSKEWVSRPINSSSFKQSSGHSNTVIADIDSDTILADNVTFGAYHLPDFLKRAVGGAEPITIESIDVNAVLGELSASSYRSDSLVHVSSTTVYLGKDSSSPEIGDIRVTFTQIPPAEVSIIAQVIRDTFEQFTASNGYTFSRLEMGTVGMAKMFEGARSDNNFKAWLFRIAGIIGVVIGLRLIFRPLSVIADVIPLLGTIVEAGAGVVGFLIGLAWSLLVIAVAWVRFRPLVAGGLIAAALALVALSYAKGRKAEA